MEHKTAIVTGAYGGIGAACAADLIERGHDVVIAGRDRGKGEALARTLGARAHPLALDLASLASVHAFPAALDALELPPVRALVLNAATMSLSRAPTATADGIEANFGVNHLGHFALTLHLLAVLADPARIVVVSSSGHDPTTMAGRSGPPAWPGAEALASPVSPNASQMAPMSRYTTSKLCNVLFAYELDRRLAAAGRRVAVNAFDPGVVLGTTLGRELSAFNRFLLSQPWLLRVAGARVVTSADAGRHLASLAADPAFEGMRGKYFEGTREVKSSADSYDLDRA
ncbi:MAG: SDR family NAD(P)-dependent oxidoreductase, partial [Myxococcales bacterium]|nr:SDR family NAD(P)-dependent oxidoreductase [Myxococcales bacterium]